MALKGRPLVPYARIHRGHAPRRSRRACAPSGPRCSVEPAGAWRTSSALVVRRDRFSGRPGSPWGLWAGGFVPPTGPWWDGVRPPCDRGRETATAPAPLFGGAGVPRSPPGTVDRCGLFPVRHRPRLGARLRVRRRLRAPGVRGEGRPPTRPVLKHGPRSLTRARVQGSVETPRRNEGEGRIRRRPRWDPPAPWSGRRTAGPPRPLRRGGGARAYVLGPERW